MPAPKVFVIQNHASYNNVTGAWVPRFDLSPAEQFGELVFLLPPSSFPDKPGQAISIMRKKLQDFCDEDHLLLIGNPCFIAFGCAIASDINEGRVSLLQYSSKHKRYNVVKADGLIEFE